MFSIFFFSGIFAFQKHKPLRKNIHGRLSYPTPETPCFCYFSTFWTCFWVIFVIDISRIIKNFVGAFDKMEKYKKLPIFFIYNLGKDVAF